jgi:hypothetical protein
MEILFPRFCARTIISKICPPFTESPFARSRRYLLRCDLMGHMGRHYPSSIATSSSCARPKSSLGLRFSLVPRVFAGCGKSLLEVGPSRRYLCESFSTCLDPYPGGSCGAFTRFFPQNYDLPSCLTRSALSLIHTMATSVWLTFRGCSHSLMFKPVDLLATQVAPTAANIFLAEQPWLLHPNTSRFVTSPCPGYANRPIRATDGKRTYTSQDSQPCRLFLDRSQESEFRMGRE